MADPVIIAVKTHQARDEVAAECRKLAASLEIDPPAVQMPIQKDSDFKTLQETQGQVEFLKRVNAAVAQRPPKPKPQADQAKPTVAAQAKPAVQPVTTQAKK